MRTDSLPTILSKAFMWLDSHHRKKAVILRLYETFLIFGLLFYNEKQNQNNVGLPLKTQFS